MAGYWPRSFFACLWTRKKRMRPISSHLDRTRLVNKGFIKWDKTPEHDKLSLRDKARLHLARSGSQSHREIWFILSRFLRHQNDYMHSCLKTLFNSFVAKQNELFWTVGKRH